MPTTIKAASQLRPGEHIIMILHRHWIVFAFKIGYILGLIVTTIIILSMMGPLVEIFGTGIFW